VLDLNRKPECEYCHGAWRWYANRQAVAGLQRGLKAWCAWRRGQFR